VRHECSDTGAPLSADSIPRMRASPRHAPTLASCFAPRLAPTATRSAPFLSCTEEEAEPTPPPTPATVRTARSDALDATSSSTSPSTPTGLRLCWCAPQTTTIGMCTTSLCVGGGALPGAFRDHRAAAACRRAGGLCGSNRSALGRICQLRDCCVSVYIVSTTADMLL
jgi:hypothetical protein